MAVQFLQEHFSCEEQFSPVKKGNIIAGRFQKADVKNANGRVYRRSLWETILSRPDIKNQIKDRVMVGELGHPDCIETTPVNISHIVTKLELLPNGDVYGEAEILDTPSGRILKTLYDAGVKMGISSRGFLPEGSNPYTEAGVDGVIVPDDFELVTFDFVIIPSTPGAHPTVKESVQQELSTILAEGASRINKQVVDYVQGTMLVPLKESTSLLHRSKVVENKKEEKSVPGMNAYVSKLEDIIEELRTRYLAAENLCTALATRSSETTDMLQEATKRYLTAENIIKALAEYANTLESSLADMANMQGMTESILEELRSRYTLSEQVIADMASRLNLSEQVIADLRNRHSVAESTIEDLTSKYQDAIAAPVGQQNAARELEVAESVIAELRSMIKEGVDKSEGHTLAEAKETSSKKGRKIPAGYFEGLAEKYGVSVTELRTIFEGCGRSQKAFEFHLSERKRLVSTSYNEYPFMKNGSPSSVSEGAEVDQNAARLARLVERTL